MSEHHSSEILAALAEHRAETRGDMAELRSAIVKMADGVADMSRTMARSEERHSQHEAGMQRIGGQLDDHETRVRFLEMSKIDPTLCLRHQEKLQAIETQLNTNTIRLSTGWGAFVTICAGLAGLAGLVFAAVKIIGV